MNPRAASSDIQVSERASTRACSRWGSVRATKVANESCSESGTVGCSCSTLMNKGNRDGLRNMRMWRTMVRSNSPQSNSSHVTASCVQWAIGCAVMQAGSVTAPVTRYSRASWRMGADMFGLEIGVVEMCQRAERSVLKYCERIERIWAGRRKPFVRVWRSGELGRGCVRSVWKSERSVSRSEKVCVVRAGRPAEVAMRRARTSELLERDGEAKVCADAVSEGFGKAVGHLCGHDWMQWRRLDAMATFRHDGGFIQTRAWHGPRNLRTCQSQLSSNAPLRSSDPLRIPFP